MHRRQLIKGFAVLAMAELPGLWQAAWAAGTKLPPPGLYRVTGEVRINGQIAREGSPVAPGDTITTGKQSEAIYIIGKDAYLQRDSSTVNIASDILKGGLRVLSGKLLAVFGKGEKRIEAGTATIGIRGTGCYIEAEEKQVYFCLCYGTADISSSRMPGKIETIETRHHENPVMLHADGSQMMEKAPMINHTDAELVLLESLLGRVPPFYGQPEYRY